MTVNIRIDTKQLERLEREFGKAVARRPMQRALLYLQSHVDRLEPKAPGAFTRTATPRQKRAFWARVRRGLASVGDRGYIRTGQTARAWTTKVQEGGRRGVLGNNAPGARWVFGETTQQPFNSHQPRIDRIAERETRAIVRIYEDEIRRLLP